jgi:hydrogenase nickel incorporation protein HypA/HybF
MHELAICQSIMLQAAAIAATHGAVDVIGVKLCIGPLSGVEPQSLRAAFPLAAAGTCCEGARLTIEISAVRVACRLCFEATEAAPNRLLCGACGTWRVALLQGDEMRIVSVDISQEEMALV